MSGELTIRKGNRVRVHHEKKSDRVTVDHERKSDLIKVHYEKKSEWGKSLPRERAMG